MPTLRIAASTVSSGSLSEDIFVWGVLFMLAFAIIRVIARKMYSHSEKETTIIHVQTPQIKTRMESPCVSYITINIHHRTRTMSDIQLPPPSSSEEKETKKEV